MGSDRALRALEGVLPVGTRVTVGAAQDHDAVVELAGLRLRLRWLPVGWPRQVAEALSREPRPDVVAAPLLSPGARELARRRGVGWLDESGAAEIRDGMLLISVSGVQPTPPSSRLGWRSATLAVCEVLLTGCPATASAVTARTGLAASTVTGALKFLDRGGFLAARAARGRLSGRYVTDPDALLDAYAVAAERLRPPTSLRVGALWRDPLQGVIEAGGQWHAAGIRWAVTGALSADVMAPMLAEPTPIEIYVAGRTTGDLRKAAEISGLRIIQGGRILLRPFPTPANDIVAAEVKPGLFSVFWPRSYADLRTVGVRGEDAAEHLREEMSRGRHRTDQVTGSEDGS
jgi:hypothetical protein